MIVVYVCDYAKTVYKENTLLIAGYVLLTTKDNNCEVIVMEK